MMLFLSTIIKCSLLTRWIQLVTLHFLLIKTRAQMTMEFSIVEESPPQTFIGNLNNAPLLNGMLDSRGGSGGTFQLLTQTNLFHLNSSTGELFTRTVIDRERICPESRNFRLIASATNIRNKPEPERTYDPPVLSEQLSDTMCVIKLQALHFTNPQHRQTDGQSHRVLILKLTVLDINDNAPSWQEGIIHISVPEHSPIGTRFPLPAAFDPDCGPMNTTVNYALLDSTSDRRSSNVRQFNQHGHDAFQLDIEPIQDLNPPELNHVMWTQQTMYCTRRTFRLWLRVTRDLEYDEISTETHPGERDFSANTLPLKQLHLQLTATDGGQPVALTGSVLVNISVGDINDHPPIFKQRQTGLTATHTESMEDIVDVDENTPVGRIIYIAQATDLDESDRGRLQYSLGTSASRLIRTAFEVNVNTGEVILLQSPDYEKQKSFTVPLTVTDSKHTASLNLLVRINNQNDHPPIITVQPVGQPRPSSGEVNFKGTQGNIPFTSARSVTLYITEHDPPGRFIATVFVNDLDETNGAAVGYNGPTHVSPYLIPSSSALSGLSSTFFEIGSPTDTGIRCQVNHAGLALAPLFEGAVNQFKLITRTSFDREQQSEHFTTLVCYDKGQHPLSAQVGIHLIINDINDHAPMFKNQQMIAHLKENEPAGTIVYTVEATDLDLDINAQLRFSLSPENVNDFSIDSISGIIRSLRTFDREYESQFNLTVTVRDQVELDQNKIDAVLNLPNSSLNSINGIFQSQKRTEHHSIKANLIVHIDDVNDCPPVFGNSLYQLSVAEDAKINFLVGQIKANDSDATETNNLVHYLIKAQTENEGSQEFRVSPKGHIYVARGNLDRERVSSYNFYLVAVDSGVPVLSSSTQVHIYVTDVNDNPPTWVFPAQNNQAINVTVSEPVGYCVTQLNAVDPDEGENGEVSYRLIQTSRVATPENFDRGGPSPAKSFPIPNRHLNGDTLYPGHSSGDRHTVGTLFELDPTSGSIYVSRSMSLNDIGSLKLVVEASDKGQPAKVNHRVLQVNIVRYLSDSATGRDESSFGTSEKGRYRMYSSSGVMGHMEYDLVVIVIMVAVTLIISLALIIAILFLRCGICSNRGIAHYNTSIPPDYRHDSGHTHHLEEVFRDSGNVEIDGLLPPGMEHFSHGNQFSDTSLNSFQQTTENEPMCRSFLSTPGADPWVVTSLSPRKTGAQQPVEFIKFNRLGGSIARVQSPIGEKFESGKRGSLVGSSVRSKQCGEATYRSPSASTSPEHEMQVMLTKRQMVRTNPSSCSTFRASCSHLTQARSNTPCKSAAGKSCEDIESMDSGHGRSSTTDNGTTTTNEPTGGHHSSALKGHTNAENCHLEIPNSKSGTLPLNFSLEKNIKEGLSGSVTDIPSQTRSDVRTPINTSQAQTHKTRQTVSWREPDYQTCNQPNQAQRTIGYLVDNRHSPGCQATRSGEVNGSTDGTLVLFSPVDPSGYAQLVHPSLPSLTERDSPKQSLYSAFPTSFV